MSLGNMEDMKKQAIDQLSTQIEKAYKCGCKDGKRQSQDLIEQAYQRGFNAGQVDNQTFHESICDGCKKGFEDREMELIELGRQEAWEAADKIAGDCLNESRMTKELFNFSYAYGVFENISASEAIEKIKAYEEKKQEIKVGDEVIFEEPDFTGIVLYVDEFVCVITPNFDIIRVKKEQVKKVGHSIKIADVLARLKEGYKE